MKRTIRLALPAWAVQQQEEYFANMAARGLFVRRCGSIFTHFDIGEPEARIYRLDAAPSRNAQPPAEQRQFYESCGWRYVCKADYFNLYCAPAGTQELHTDEQWQSETLAPVRRSLRTELVSAVIFEVFWLGLIFFQFSLFRHLSFADTWTLLLANFGLVLPVLIVLLMLLKIGRAAGAMASVIRLSRRLRSGNAERPKSIRGFLVCSRALSVMQAVCIAAACVCFLSLLPHSVPLGQEPDSGRLIRLEQIDPDVSVWQGEGKLGQKSAVTDVRNTPIAPLQYDSVQLSGYDDPSPTLYQHYFAADGAVDPIRLAQAAASYWGLWEMTELDAESLPGGLDYALLNDEMKGVVNLCAASGDRVLFVSYLGDADADALLQAAAAAIGGE